MIKKIWPFSKKSRIPVDTTNEVHNTKVADPGFDPNSISPINHSDFIQWPYALPLPSQQLMSTVSFGSVEQFYFIGEQWAHLVTRFLPEKPKVLDMGCGCGKLARFLLLNPKLYYIGFDLFNPSIQWCNNNFGIIAGDRFVFKHFNGYSSVWNPEGKISALDYNFPVEDNGVNFVVAASLFTHLTEPECVHYLSEVQRVLEPGGQALFSIHDEPAEGIKYSGDHSRIDIDASYFVKLVEKHGLILKEDIGDFIGQHALLFEHNT